MANQPNNGVVGIVYVLQVAHENRMLNCGYADGGNSYVGMHYLKHG